MKKSILIILILALLILPTTVFADGAMYIYDRDQWNLGKENQQQVAINYQDGYQNMLISINLSDELHGERAVWIFPVPATPEKVAIDILKGYPTFNGQDIDSKYDREVKNIGYGMAGYSTFPIGLIGMFGFMGMGSRGYNQYATATADTLSVNGLVTVHETIQEMGLTTELITAKDEDALNEYFEEKGLNLPDSSDRIFKEYIGKDYTFVVSYISDLDAFKQESGNKVITDIHGYPVYNNAPNYNYRVTPQVGVFVKFPTDKIYFPLKPTSVYESQEVPMLMYVVGHVNPRLYPEIKQQSEITYYTQSGYHTTEQLENFFNGKTNISNFKYTKIKLNAPSKYLVDDLWISNSAPLWVSFKSLYTSVSWLFGILIYVLLSILASLIAGLISFSNEPVPKKTLLIHGLWNCLTAVGLLVATISLKTKKIDTKIQNQLRSQGIEVVAKDERKIVYFILFYVFFLSLLAGISLLLMAI